MKSEKKEALVVFTKKTSLFISFHDTLLGTGSWKVISSKDIGSRRALGGIIAWQGPSR